MAKTKKRKPTKAQIAEMQAEAKKRRPFPASWTGIYAFMKALGGMLDRSAMSPDKEIRQAAALRFLRVSEYVPESLDPESPDAIPLETDQEKRVAFRLRGAISDAAQAFLLHGNNPWADPLYRAAWAAIVREVGELVAVKPTAKRQQKADKAKAFQYPADVDWRTAEDFSPALRDIAEALQGTDAAHPIKAADLHARMLKINPRLIEPKASKAVADLKRTHKYDLFIEAHIGQDAPRGLWWWID